MICVRKSTEEIPRAGLCIEPGFDAMSRLKEAEIMLGSDAPKLLNPHVNRYLILLFNSLQHQLRIMTVCGAGPRPSGISGSCVFPRDSLLELFYRFIYLFNN